ncbi:hypothetical protein D2189_14560 [Escherichia coli]|nr:hypothetical protein D2189_14560 [Escherichia coli]
MFHTIVSIKNDGHYFCRAGGNRPDGLNEPVTLKAQNLQLDAEDKKAIAALDCNDRLVSPEGLAPEWD